jgi:DNA-binding NarL/FixJ family response regulator
MATLIEGILAKPSCFDSTKRIVSPNGEVRYIRCVGVPLGEAVNFAETLKLTTMLEPDVLLLDLHMPDERLHPPELVKNHVAQHTGCVLGISIWNDAAARLLAESLGARVLFDKANMATELVSGILRFCTSNRGEGTRGD